MTGILTAAASAGDLAQLLPFYRSAAARPDCPWDEWYPDQATLAADQAQGRLFCARTEEGALVGAYALDFDDPETNALSCWNRGLEPAGEVVRLLVVPAWEGQGMGGRLLADAVRRLAAMGCRSCRILVARDNRRALRAYARLDFCPVGQARLYDTDFVCFEKELL